MLALTTVDSGRSGASAALRSRSLMTDRLVRVEVGVAAAVVIAAPDDPDAPDHIR
jgi:hypothetical protein